MIEFRLIGDQIEYMQRPIARLLPDVLSCVASDLMHVLEKDFDAIEEANCKAIDEAVEAAEREKDWEIERLEDDNASLKGDIEKLEEENNELIAENDQLKDKEGVKELIDSLKAKVEHLTDSAIDWRRKAEALQDELNKLRQPKRRGRSRKLAA